MLTETADDLDRCGALGGLDRLVARIFIGSIAEQKSGSVTKILCRLADERNHLARVLKRDVFEALR